MSGRIIEFQESGCEVLGISTDDIDTHVRWLTMPSHEGGLGAINFPLAADPTGEVCQRYGVYLERRRVAQRGVFIVDPNGVLQYQVVHSLSVGRNTDELLRVLDALQSGGLCPGEREINGPTIDVKANLRSGRVVGPYQLDSKLGEGTFGAVFRAHDTLLDRPVALKILNRDDEEATNLLLNEARAAAALNHPNLCAVHTIDTSNGAAIIVMEFVEGRPLSEIIEEGSLSIDQSIAYGRQIAAGMAHAHEANVIHGDLKPANLMVTPDGAIKIMDFGLSQRKLPEQHDDETLPYTPESGSKGLSGTLAYLAPERASGSEATAASDTFAVGLIIYEMATGQRAIQGNALLATLVAIEQFDPEPLLNQLPEKLHGPLSQTLSRQPSQRPTMAELAQQLAKVR